MTSSSPRWLVGVGITMLLIATAALGSGQAGAPGAERELARVQARIGELQRAGFDKTDEKLRLLIDERNSLAREIHATSHESLVLPLPPSDNRFTDGMEQGEITCEAIPPYTRNAGLISPRCVSVLRPQVQEALFIFLTATGSALVVTFGDTKTSAERHTIPELADLSRAKITVDTTGEIHVTTDAVDVEIPTGTW